MKITAERKRAASFDSVRTEGAAVDAPATVRFTFSSEFPVLSYDYQRNEYFYEVLNHDRAAIETTFLERGLSLLVEHRSDRRFGILKNWDLKGRMLEGDVIFSDGPDGQLTEKDMRKGLAPYSSVRYRFTGPGVVIGVASDGLRIVRFPWQPLEASSVSVPADPTVGVPDEKRSAPSGEMFQFTETELEDGVAVAEVEKMLERDLFFARSRGARQLHEPPVDTKAQGGAGGGSATAVAAEPVDVEKVRAEARKQEREHAAALRKFGRDFEIDPLVIDDCVDKGLTLEQTVVVARESRKTKTTPVQGQPGSEQGALGLPDKDRKRYSFLRALELAARLREGRAIDGIEGEVHQELLKRRGKEFQSRGGILMPLDMRTVCEDEPKLARICSPYEAKARTLTTYGAGKGAETVFDQPGELIEMIRARTILTQLGVRIRAGLQGPVPFPKKTGAMTGQWMQENPVVGATKSDMAFGTSTLLPHTIICYGGYSRQFLGQSSIDVETEIRADIARAHAELLEVSAYVGTGVNAQPSGIYNTANVLTETFGGVPTYIKISEALGKIADKDALFGSVATVTTPLVGAALKATLEAQAAGARWIWNGSIGDGEVAGYPAHTTSLMPKTLGSGSDHGWITANWLDLLVGFWAGGIEMIVDPYKLKEFALIEITSYEQADVMVRHAESFCVGLTVAAA